MAASPLIFFDAVGTLIYPNPPVYEAYQSIGQKFGSGLTEEDISERFKIAFKKHFPFVSDINTLSNEELEKKRWKSVVDDVFKNVSIENPDLFHELWQHFATPEHWKVYEDTMQYLEKITHAGIYTGLASNFDKRILTICETLLPMIEPSRIFYSTDLGYAKPNVNFYKTIENIIEEKSQIYIMVGDDWENDVKAAQNAGWDTVHRDELDKLLTYLDI